MLRGAFGPSRKTLGGIEYRVRRKYLDRETEIRDTAPELDEYRRMGDAEQEKRGEEEMAKVQWRFDELDNKREGELARIRILMGTRYAMDALNIRNPRTRGIVYKIARTSVEQSMRREARGQGGELPLATVREINRQLKEELGFRFVPFTFLFNRKVKRISRHI